MSYLSPLRVGLVLPLALYSQAAFADLTPTQVWGDWRQYLEGMGYQINADEATDGDNITIEGLEISMDMPDDAGTISVSMGTIGFVQNSDGSVDVQLPDTLPMNVNFTPDATGADPVSVKFDYTQTGHNVTVSGSPEAMVYDYSADTFAMVLNELNVDGKIYGEQNAKMNVSGTDITSNTTMTKGELRQYQQSGKIATLGYDLFMDNPEEPVKIKMVGSVADIGFDGTGAIPLVISDPNDMAAMMKAGFAMAGNFSFGSGATQIEVSDPENGDFSGTTASQGGSLGVVMNEESLVYNAEQNGLEMNLQAAALPFPVAMTMAKGGFNLAVPISKDDAPQDFAFGFTLADFTMSDMIWSIFDPTSQLPRDPATIAVDLTGKVKILADLMDPNAAGMMASTGPGEVHALTIKNLLVSAAGAKVEGTGDLTFDNSDLVTFGGMPKPVGAVNMSIAGANGLMDKLVAMGLLPDEQAMGARMMMGMFAVAGSEPDTLSSKIEFTEDNQVLANGQRIK